MQVFSMVGLVLGINACAHAAQAESTMPVQQDTQSTTEDVSPQTGPEPATSIQKKEDNNYDAYRQRLQQEAACNREIKRALTYEYDSPGEDFANCAGYEETLVRYLLENRHYLKSEGVVDTQKGKCRKSRAGKKSNQETPVCRKARIMDAEHIRKFPDGVPIEPLSY